MDIRLQSHWGAHWGEMSVLFQIAESDKKKLQEGVKRTDCDVKDAQI